MGSPEFNGLGAFCWGVLVLDLPGTSRKVSSPSRHARRYSPDYLELFMKTTNYPRLGMFPGEG